MKTPESTRRDFMKSTAVAGAALVVGAGCEGKEGTETTPIHSPFDDVPVGQVALARGETAAAAIAKGLALMGGLSFIRPGQVVMLKPNMTGPIPPPDTTSPEVLVALIDACHAAGAGEVIVAERTFGPLLTTSSFGATIYGNDMSMLDYVEAAGATFRPLDDEPWLEVLPKLAVDYEEPLLIPKILDEVDHFINVPALKTHNLATFTMTMKNLFGFIHPDTRNNQVHGHPKNDADPERMKRMFAQMNLPFSPTLNVMDAIVSRTTGGPMPPGDVVETNMVLFGKDRVAMDAVGLAILKVVGSEPWVEDKPVWDQTQLAEAVKIGIGVSGPDDIVLVGDGVEEIGEIEAKLREVAG